MKDKLHDVMINVGFLRGVLATLDEQGVKVTSALDVSEHIQQTLADLLVADQPATKPSTSSKIHNYHVGGRASDRTSRMLTDVLKCMLDQKTEHISVVGETKLWCTTLMGRFRELLLSLQVTYKATNMDFTITFKGTTVHFVTTDYTYRNEPTRGRDSYEVFYDNFS